MQANRDSFETQLTVGTGILKGSGPGCTATLLKGRRDFMSFLTKWAWNTIRNTESSPTIDCQIPDLPTSLTRRFPIPNWTSKYMAGGITSTREPARETLLEIKRSA